MSAKTDWIDGWETGVADAEARTAAAGRDPVRLDFVPAEISAPPADPAVDRFAWEDGYVFGTNFAVEPSDRFSRRANPHA